MTRSYGRGTDFMCANQGLVKNRGVHVVVTFLPEDDSAQKQIYGRTCRQDDPGSCQMILFEDNFKSTMKASQVDQSASGLNWDNYLTQTRNEVLNRKCERLSSRHHDGITRHQRTIEVLKHVQSNVTDIAKQLFFEISQGSMQGEESQDCHHRCILVLDRSGSMQGEPWKDLKQAVNGFVEIMAKSNSRNLISIVVSVTISCEKVAAIGKYEDLIVETIKS